ncbi:MAG: nucleotide sugar dehydrogenase [Candidatus Omnitrophica bacterium]|nr:nucleotide sugar dehydrogenase [Candidatus Omnitrophota bacterium]
MLEKNNVIVVASFVSPYEESRKKIRKQCKNFIESKKAIISVIGLGYVGLPMAMEFCSKGFTVRGYDKNLSRIKDLRNGISYINDIKDQQIRSINEKCNFKVSESETILDGSDVIIMCVPTPLSKTRTPDVSYIVASTKSLAKHLKKGQLVVIESTTYPGTTRDLVKPLLEKTGLICGEDVFLAFSPERIDPGNPKYDFSNIPKVVGGITEKATKLAKILYSTVVEKVIEVSSPEVAEVTKLLENTFRSVNIGLINEFAHVCHRLNIDVWEVIEAAKTKPFGFMPFYPGPGIGGHCIPADPVYLSWRAKKIGFKTKMIDLATKVNYEVPLEIVARIKTFLNKNKVELQDAKILIMGVTYKKDINDLRDSPALDTISALLKLKIDLCYHDPFIPSIELGNMKSKKLSKALLKDQDLVVILADHTNVDYKMIAENTKLIFDTRNIFGKLGIKKDHIVKL